MKTTQAIFVSSLLFGAVACGGGGVGDVKFELAIDNDNTRTVTVDFGGQQTTFTAANVIVIMDQVTLEGAVNTDIINVPTPARFDAEREVEFEFQVEENDFTGVALTLGVADAATALAAGEENIEGRSFHIEGTIDTDFDGVEESGIVVYAPAAQTKSFAVPFSVVEGVEVVPEVLIDLQVLLDGVDFALAEVVNGELALTEDNATDQTPIISANVANAFELIIE